MVWNPWQKINVQIPVRKAAPIIFNGRLYVFWTRITTLAKTVFEENRSIFTGYDHKFSIEFTTLKLDGSWTPPQKLNLKNNYPFTGNGVLQDPLIERSEIDELGSLKKRYLEGKLSSRFIALYEKFFGVDDLRSKLIKLNTPRYDTKPHYEPIDEYTLDGFMWDEVYPTVHNNRLVLTGTGYQMISEVDFYDLSTEQYGYNTNNGRELYSIELNPPNKILWVQNDKLFRQNSIANFKWFYNYAYCSLIVNTTKSDSMILRHWDPVFANHDFDSEGKKEIAKFNDRLEIQIVNGAYSDAIIDNQGDLLFIQGTPFKSKGFHLKRIGTTLSETLTRTLFTTGVNTMLNIETQLALKEAKIPLTITDFWLINKVV